MPEILVEFVPDFSKIEGAVEEMKSSGTISKPIIDAFKQSEKGVVDFAKTTSDSGKKVNKTLTDVANNSKKSGKAMTDAFKAGLKKSLDEGRMSLDDFNAAMGQTEKKSTTLKQKLRDMTEQLAQMEVEGKGGTEAFIKMQHEAGELRDAIEDVNLRIRQTASDTQKLDTAIQFVSGVTAAFGIMQSVVALAGEENEDLQRALLKVNSAMTILVGLQQLQNILQKESNLMMGIRNVQAKIGVVITNLDTAATSKNIVRKTAAVAVQRVLNTVMKANPAFLLVTAFTALAGAIALFTGNTKAAEKAAKGYTDELERMKSSLDDTRALINLIGSTEIKLMELNGAKASEITKKRIDLMKQERLRMIERRDEFINMEDEILANAELKHKDRIEKFNKARDEEMALDREISQMNTAIRNEEIQGLIDVKEERKAALEERKQLSEKAAELERNQIKKGFEDYKAGIEAQLVAVEDGSFRQLELKKDLLRAELQMALSNEELTSNQRLLLVKQYFSNRKKLDEEYYRSVDIKSKENQINLINAELDAIRLSFEERERLTIDLLNAQRDAELLQVQNNKTKEKEINARFDREIYEQRKAIGQAALEEELSDFERNAHIRKSILADTAGDSSFEFDTRRAALAGLQELELRSITTRRLANQEALKQGVIDYEDYSEAAQQIANDEFDIKSKFAKDFTALSNEETKKQREDWMNTVDAVAKAVGEVLQILSTVFATIAENEQTRVNDERERITQMRENNMITQKEEEQRLKQVEQAERAAKRRQAQREKTMALFEAFVNGAAAIIKASADPFLLPFTIALVAAQISAIASREIPKFGKGVKKAPKGFAQVAETGTELVKTDKGYFLAEHPQIIWMKGGERVYNPMETAAMVGDVPKADMVVINSGNNGVQPERMNYKAMAKELGKEIAKHPKNIINLDEHGFTRHVTQQNNITKYLNKRYTFYD